MRTWLEGMWHKQPALVIVVGAAVLVGAVLSGQASACVLGPMLFPETFVCS